MVCAFSVEASTAFASAASGFVVGAIIEVGGTLAASAIAGIATTTPLGAIVVGCTHPTTIEEGISLSPPNHGAVMSCIEGAVGESDALEVLASRATVLPSTVQDCDLKWVCWHQLLNMPVHEQVSQKKNIMTLIEQGIIVEVDATSVVGQNGCKFHLCPVLRHVEGEDGGALEFIGMHVSSP